MNQDVVLSMVQQQLARSCRIHRDRGYQRGRRSSSFDLPISLNSGFDDPSVCSVLTEPMVAVPLSLTPIIDGRDLLLGPDDC